ncbi:MAG: aminotransferase class I/II-fold pyridoxal phosphate-dependent enzyme [Thermoanaerobaculia bacterium]
MDSNWITCLGPQLDAFERELAEYVDVRAAVALSSGTAALHLALILLGVERGDRVLCSTLTFVATANAILYCGAEPVFIDSDLESWNMDPDLLEEELQRSAARGPAQGGDRCRSVWPDRKLRANRGHLRAVFGADRRGCRGSVGGDVRPEKTCSCRRWPSRGMMPTSVVF